MHGLRRTFFCLLLWTIALAAAGYRMVGALHNLTAFKQDWRSVGQDRMLDFRDTVMLPGQFLLQGENPYDPRVYLAAHPWAQEFVPYSPTWLSLTSPLSWLPYRTAAGIFLLLMFALAAWFTHSLARWGAGVHAWWFTPTLLAWSQVWYPMRSTQETGSSLLVGVGVYLVIKVVSASTTQEVGDSWLGGLGLTLALIKPTFGLALLILLLFMRQFQIIGRGIILAAATSAPAGMLAVLAAGGLPQFVDSVIRDLAHASSPDSPTGLLSPVQQRVDVIGMAVRLGSGVPSQAVETLASFLILAMGGLVLARRPASSTIIVLLAVLPLLVFVHMPYDFVLLLVPAAHLIGRAIALKTPVAIAVAAISIVPVLHIHRISSLILGLNDTQADLLDVSSMLILVTIVATTSFKTSKVDALYSA